MDRLSSGLEGRATIMLSGPGYGKTSLVGRFLHEHEEDSVWYWLDPTDGDPRTLFRYLIRGIKEHAPDFGERSELLWKDLRTHPFEVERLADIFMSEAEESLDRRIVLVLDGVQHLEGSSLCARALHRLLTYLPGTLYLILLGRSAPDLGAKSLSAEGAVAVIEGDELLFTLEETEALLVGTYRLKITPGTVRRVHARTRGWVTALQLLRQTARLEPEAPDLPEEVFARTESEIFDYLSEEVFASEEKEVREFLLGSSLPSFIDPDICAEVLADGEGRGLRTILSRLTRRHLFLSPLESQGEYYAYDPLFLDFLRRKLRAEAGPAAKRALDLRYGQAYAHRGAFTQALSHWIAAEEVGGVSKLLERHGKALLDSGTLETVLQAAQFLTEHGVRTVAIEDLQGEAYRLSGDYPAAIGHFETALGMRGKKGEKLEGDARASTLQGLAYSLLKTGEPGRAGEIAMEALEESNRQDPALTARILNTLSIIRYRENRLHEALDGWKEALGLARRAKDEHLVLMIAHNLGLPHAVRGDFRRASECFQILTSPDNARVGPQEGAAHLNLARIGTLRAEFDSAALFLSDAKEIARKFKLQALSADVLEAEGTLLREMGDLNGADERYRRARTLFMELGQMDLLANLAEEEAILASLRGNAHGAEEQATGLVERARESGDDEALASSLLALGEIQVRSGHWERARSSLGDCAARFNALDRAYQQCMARLWLALACHQNGDARAARAEADEALSLAAQFDYGAGVSKIAQLDESFRRELASLPSGAPFSVVLSAETAGSASVRPQELPVRPGVDLTVRLLGPIEVFRDHGRKIPPSAWKIRRSLDLFCYLATSRNRRATKDRIVEALWGSARPAVIEKNFHPTISFLRRALNHAHSVPKNFILFEKGAYLLNPAYTYEIDTELFEEAIRSAKGKASRGDARGGIAEYTVALALFRGSFLDEDYSEWTEAPRAHFDELYLGALQETARLHREFGDPETGIMLLKQLVEREPLDEEASCHLMKALGRQGSRAGVEKEFSRLARALREELSAAPEPKTLRAYEESLAAGTNLPGAGDQGPETRPASGRSPRQPLKRNS